LSLINYYVDIRLRRASTDGGFFIISPVFLLFLKVFSSLYAHDEDGHVT
jgi:hypothetical protein